VNALQKDPDARPLEQLEHFIAHEMRISYRFYIRVSWRYKGRPDPDCAEKFRRMRIYGDGTVINPAIDNTAAESIVNRLVQLLQYLDRRGPQHKWGDYLENGAPKWDRIALAGQSQGAGMAAIIAKRHEVARVILFSSPWDFVVTDGNVRRLASWLSAPSKTPPQRWYGGYHKQENMAGLIARAYAAVRQLSSCPGPLTWHR
jgi:hypothetical protein